MGDEVNQSMSIKEYSKAMIFLYPLQYVSDLVIKLIKMKVEELRKC